MLDACGQRSEPKEIGWQTHLECGIRLSMPLHRPAFVYGSWGRALTCLACFAMLVACQRYRLMI